MFSQTAFNLKGNGLAMKLKIWIGICLFFLGKAASALSDFDYLPIEVSYQPGIPLPQEILGAPVGEWHVRHDQLVNYMRALANSSQRVSLVETGRTHENRPLLLLAITSEENQKRLDEIQQTHLDAVVSGKPQALDAPLILWMGYSVHGDEPSGSNASMLVAYYLAAGQGGELDKLLDNAVVLLDPSLNPDGLSRFAQWANMHKGRNLVSDPEHREHVQAWPSGRTNHYWFDLNRDWLLLTHPESRARIKQFQQWRPHVLTDFHEMGTNSSYFFQPGVASRKNPWTPDGNVELTEKLAEYHAASLDKRGKLYFTQEGFDDFYYGKGSTYPDAQGTVGILFEQASSRGHLQQSIYGELSFVETIQNQLTTSLSTFTGAIDNKRALQNYQHEFVKQTQHLIEQEGIAGYLVTEQYDASRFNAFKQILQQHQIEFKYLEKGVQQGDVNYPAINSIFIPIEQGQYRLIKSIFSTRKSFEDNTFYDVSNWNLALAFNLDYTSLEKRQARKLSLTESPDNNAFSATNLDREAYAFAFSWRDSNAPKLLQNLLSSGIQVQLSGKAFSAVSTSDQTVDFQPGAVVVPSGLAQPRNYHNVLATKAAELGIQVWSISTGLTPSGIDLGSRQMKLVTAPRLLLVGGKNTSQYEVGEVWHYLDTKLDLPATIMDLSRLNSLNLDAYSHIIMVQGNYNSVAEATASKIADWVEQGGILIGQKSASVWFGQKKWLKAEYLAQDDLDKAFDTNNLMYKDRESLAAKKRVAGAVFEANLDLSHPLAFGYTRESLPVFRNHTRVMKSPIKPFTTPLRYSTEPLKAGYAAAEFVQLVANHASVVAHNVGEGKIIALADNVNFRGYWYGTSRLMANAIYMSVFINAQG